MAFPKRVLALPLLSATWAASCTDSGFHSMSQRELDVRFAICAFCISVSVIVIASIAAEASE